MNSQPHLLVVDDDPIILALLQTYFSDRGYPVSTAENGVQMRRILATATVDLVIVDLVMPSEDGLSLTRYLRDNHPEVAVIIVTSKGESADRVVGLEMGADDYVVKPFDCRELLARVKSVLRRLVPKNLDDIKKPATSSEPERIQFGEWQLDLGRYELISVQGRKVELTTGEFDLLKAFVTHPHRVLSRDELLLLTHNREAGPFDRTIDVQVGRLRRKIEIDPAKPELIKTIRGAGYVFTADIEELESPDVERDHKKIDTSHSVG